MFKWTNYQIFILQFLCFVFFTGSNFVCDVTKTIHVCHGIQGEPLHLLLGANAFGNHLILKKGTQNGETGIFR